MHHPNDFGSDDNKPTVPAGPRMSELFGMEEARRWAEALARDFLLFRQGKLPWSDTDHACILHGPPGTGKTTCARAVAATLKVPHIAASFADWQGAPGGHLGTTIEAMKETFALAKKHAPCVLSIEEFDSVPARSAGGSNPAYFNAFTNAMLTELDAAIKVDGLIIIGTCNYPEMLDPALTRPGRMDRLIAVHLPNIDELQGILRFHLTEAERAQLDAPYASCLRDIAALCTGFSGADVEQAVRGARRLARTTGRVLSLPHFEDVLDPPAQRLDADERRRIAIHEAGHALAAGTFLAPTDITASIVARSGSAGRVTIRLASRARTRRTFEALIIYQLAGRAAEQILLGEISDLSGGTNHQSDLAQATRLASEAVLALGFSADRRLLWRGEPKSLNDWREDGPVAEDIKHALDGGYAEALSLIASERATVERIADALLARRVLSHDEIGTLMRGSRLPAAPPRAAPPRLPPEILQPLPSYLTIRIPRADDRHGFPDSGGEFEALLGGSVLPTPPPAFLPYPASPPSPSPSVPPPPFGTQRVRRTGTGSPSRNFGPDFGQPFSPSGYGYQPQFVEPFSREPVGNDWNEIEEDNRGLRDRVRDAYRRLVKRSR